MGDQLPVGKIVMVPIRASVKLREDMQKLEEIGQKLKPVYQSPSITAIPQQPQAQDSLTEQLERLIPWAVRLGEYDAADWLKKLVGNTAKLMAEIEMEQRIKVFLEENPHQPIHDIVSSVGYDQYDWVKSTLIEMLRSGAIGRVERRKEK